MKKILFSVQSYHYMKSNMLKMYGHDLEDGLIEIKSFPDGEQYHRLLSNVEGKHCIIIGGTIDDLSTLELFDIAIACEQYGAEKLSLVIPFFGYSTMERAVKPGEIVKAKSRALLFSSIPDTSEQNEILLFDLHTEGLPYYFESNCRAKHIYCKEIVKEIALEIGGSNFVMASTDAGRAKWVESLANDIGVGAAFVFKKRIPGDETQLTGISAEVQDKTVIIYDDMIRTGGSLLKAAEAYKKSGASKIYVITTHGLFINDALNKLKQSGLISRVYATNTHPNAVAIKDEFLEVRNIEKLIFGNLK